MVKRGDITKNLSSRKTNIRIWFVAHRQMDGYGLNFLKFSHQIKILKLI